MFDLITVAELRPAAIRLASLWPPWPSSNRLVLALASSPELADRLGLAEDDLYRFEEKAETGLPPALCIILGETRITSSGSYVPEESYRSEDAIRLTKAFREPQRRAEAAERARAEKAAEAERDRLERAGWAASAAAAKEEASRKRDPSYRLRQLEEKFAAMERQGAEAK